MNKTEIITKIDSEYLKQDIPQFHVGDVISVHTRITEGDKERIQVFTGTVIARSHGGLSESFTMHRVAYGEGMERVFILHSPRIAKIEVKQEGDVRRAKLNHLRGMTGKKAKVKQRVVKRRAPVKSSKIKEVEVAVESTSVEEPAKSVANTESNEPAVVAVSTASSNKEKSDTTS